MSGAAFCSEPLDSRKPPKYLPQTPNNSYFTTVSKLVQTSIKIITTEYKRQQLPSETLYWKTGSSCLSPAGSLVVVHNAQHRPLSNSHDDPTSLASRARSALQAREIMVQEV